MDDYKRSHIPAFGNWDYEDGLPITQYFESARQAGLIRYSYEEQGEDLYSTDFYFKPVVHHQKMKTRRRDDKVNYKPHVKEQQQQKRQVKVYDVAHKAKRQETSSPPSKAPKAVDEDLYKIPPELLYSYPKKKKKGFGLFSCFVPSCAA